MARKRYKVGAKFGHAGSGGGYHIYIPIMAENLLHAISRAQKFAGLKKGFKDFWFAQEVGSGEYQDIKNDWRRFKSMMRARETEKKLKRKKYAG